MMTLRIDAKLLDLLKKHARAQGRSASATVVRWISNELHASSKARHQPTMGMFAHFEAPALHDFVEARRQAAKTSLRSLRRRARRL